ncbi:hypothetical protein CPT_Mendera_139 [Stenotrophomonas phage Mendera]|uniref:Uncharacterized protein n=1 Tax=Stenotrophomonas phage Mendera TaxID=2650877 RepID=A0A5P8PJ30_9CAUD|nr:hypothetical protein HWC60_gp262 [Stenotrophomonas phage Mendera]QFR56679.1 hypothetical protein CPT_Mendera_139 [Stenotrophomonas phage Mendera]
MNKAILQEVLDQVGEFIGHEINPDLDLVDVWVEQLKEGGSYEALVFLESFAEAEEILELDHLDKLHDLLSAELE